MLTQFSSAGLVVLIVNAWFFILVMILPCLYIVNSLGNSEKYKAGVTENPKMLGGRLSNVLGFLLQGMHTTIISLTSSGLLVGFRSLPAMCGSILSPNQFVY